MTMMMHVRRTIDGMRRSTNFTGSVYFGGFERKFDRLELSDDQEVLLISSADGPKTAVRITSIDAIEMPEPFREE